jgi:hypothetical protein
MKKNSNHKEKQIRFNGQVISHENDESIKILPIQNDEFSGNNSPNKNKLSLIHPETIKNIISSTQLCYPKNDKKERNPNIERVNSGIPPLHSLYHYLGDDNTSNKNILNKSIDESGENSETGETEQRYLFSKCFLHINKCTLI